MAITIQDPVTLAALAAIGGVIPAGVTRNFKAVGAHNPTGAPIVLTVHLVPLNGAADNSNKLFSRSVPAGLTDMCQELIGRGLKTGGQLFVNGAGLTFGFTAIDTITG